MTKAEEPAAPGPGCEKFGRERCGSEVSDCLERDALEIGATIGDSPKSQFARAIGEHLDLSLRLEPSSGYDQGFRGLQCRDRRQQEGRGGFLRPATAPHPPPPPPLRNPPQDLPP